MKLLNRDLELTKAALILKVQTWSYDKENFEEWKAIQCIEERWYIWAKGFDRYSDQWFKYVSDLNEQEILELLHFSKKLYIDTFWKKYWNIAFSSFSWWLLQENQELMILSKSIKINKYLLNQYNDIFQYYNKWHKYRLWKYILICCKNLGKKFPKLEHDEYYDYWENYKKNL